MRHNFIRESLEISYQMGFFMEMKMASIVKKTYGQLLEIVHSTFTVQDMIAWRETNLRLYIFLFSFKKSHPFQKIYRFKSRPYILF